MTEARRAETTLEKAEEFLLDHYANIRGNWKWLVPILANFADSLAASSAAPAQGEASHVYTITVLSGSPQPLRVREWGYYFAEADALKVIEENQTDISELDYYHFALLAKKAQGPLAIEEPIQWYEFIWNGNELAEVKKIECPEQWESHYIPAAPSASVPSQPEGKGEVSNSKTFQQTNCPKCEHRFAVEILLGEN